MSTQTTLLISSDFSYHHWDHHYFPLHLKQPPVETECRVDSRIFFTLLFFFCSLLLSGKVFPLRAGHHSWTGIFCLQVYSW